MTEFSADSLPNRFDFKTALPRIYQQWEESGCFHSEPNPDRKPFTIVIPPPNVTGALHLGHALNNTLQDILIRMKRMQGFEALWMPGCDHAGIATQAVVERRLREDEGKTRHDLGREKLVERIWEWKDAYEKRILGQLKQMGCSCDWERTRFTLDDVCAKAVRQTFFGLFGKGLIYRGKRLVNWDTHLQTAVSDDEVFHELVKGHFWHFKYPVINPQPGEPTHVQIATTRPETMLGDTAVAVHPDPAAALAKVESELKEKLEAASDKEKDGYKSQLEAVIERKATMLPQLEQLRDMAKDGRKLMLPLMDREIPLIADEWAKPELGSGCVKITPAHDPNDYDVWQRNKEIGAINILNPDGTLNSEAGKYAGLTMKKARAKIVADLEELELCPEIEDREIDLAHSDRSKTPIEPYLADQWFVKMAQLAQSAMDAVNDERVKIYPPRYAKSYLDWLGEKRDWCISRNLWWGHQIPVWAVTDDVNSPKWSKLELPQLESVAEATVRSEFASTVAANIADGPGEGQRTLYVCVAPGNEEIEKDLEKAGLTRESDVLDTWFSSALWPHSTLGWPEKTKELEYYYPTSTLITSRDIITLWVARMVLSGLHNMGDIPFSEVFIHPKILDGYGKTMSKSKGNGVDPLDVIEKFGADALRFGLAHLTTETQDVRMPVQFECPHCETLIDQTKKNRELPKIECAKCGKPFSTQWAKTDEDKALPRGPVVSDRFELARNFCNKLWNVSRLTLINLNGYEPAPVSDDDLSFEDHWILSRLTTVTDQVTKSLETYHYAEAARVIYEFAWDEFCSFYAEMTKQRFDDEKLRPAAQRMMAFVLDNILRLLHPMIPFITEEIWQLLGRAAPERGLAAPIQATDSIVRAAWPTTVASRQNDQLENQFARFQAVLGAIREIRARQGIAPKKEVNFYVQCDKSTVDLLTPMKQYFVSMAAATAVSMGESIDPPKTNAKVDLADYGINVVVDLTGLIDVEAEVARLTKQKENILKQITGKEKKLENENFVSRAKPEIVQRERDGLAQLKEQLASTEEALTAFN